MSITPFLLLCVLTFVHTQSDFTCEKDGMFAYNKCTQFVTCVNTGTPNALKVVQACPPGTLFDNSLHVCNWADQVKCDSNVGLVEESLKPSKNEFSAALTRNGFPAPSNEQYTNFVNGISSQGGIATKREAAMFLAQILHESGGLLHKIEAACGNGCVKCPKSYVSPGKDYPGKRYCGRGYIQLVIFIA